MKILMFNKSVVSEEYKNKLICNKIKKILKQYKKDKKLRTKSNVHGIQTTDIKDREVETFIINCFGDCIKKNYKPKKEINFELNNLWINENKKGSSNTAHTHPLSDFSGVYYVEVPKDSGLISFQHFNIHDQNLGHYFYDSEFYDAFNIFNKKYQFLIFPSTYVHRVNPSNSLKSRISISFNVSIIK
tara:strand:- start:754 stop:1314 length:561 start_codon:yes stop_codon:yes gene_type:complete